VRFLVHHCGDVSAANPTDHGPTPVAAAPECPARRATGARSRATAVFVACLATVAMFGSYALRHQMVGRVVDTTRVKLPPSAWRSLLTVTATAERTCPASVPVVVLYVSRKCPHCMAELDRWAALVRNDAPEMRCTGIAVVAAPAGAGAPNDWLPPELSAMLLWDHDAALAHALDVRFVPFAAYVTNQGLAVARVVGETSESSTAQHLLALRRLSNEERGVH
jgi:hypothetical protein